jgi:hypothetical protein
VLDLSSGRLPHINEGAPRQVSGRDFRRFSHDRLPFAFRLRRTWRLPRPFW